MVIIGSRLSTPNNCHHLDKLTGAKYIAFIQPFMLEIGCHFLLSVSVMFLRGFLLKED